jgi:hypothetical protein
MMKPRKGMTADVANLKVSTRDLKMLREDLARAQSRAVSRSSMVRFDRLIAQIDELRPLGPDGTHGDRHTPSCGCEDRG